MLLEHTKTQSTSVCRSKNFFGAWLPEPRQKGKEGNKGKKGNGRERDVRERKGREGEDKEGEGKGRSGELGSQCLRRIDASESKTSLKL